MAEQIQDPTLWQLLGQLITTLMALLMKLGSFGLHWMLWIVWIAVCLWAINWKKTRHVLAVGGWAPALLLMVLIAIVWCRLDTGRGPAFLPLPNFWWQLLYVLGLGCIAMICGWLQSVFHWTPHEITLDPPVHGHHGHAHH
jgi:magnesium-transporting ATPase (P-type)